MKEIWKDIPNYEGIYQASNKGRIRTHANKTTYTKRHGLRKWKSRVLKFKSSDHKRGGNRVSLWKDGKHKDFLVHRLIATTFLENLIDTKMTVNHKDGDRLNNYIDNLEWLSRAENIRHGFENGLYRQTSILIQKKENGNSLKFRSMAIASKYIGKNRGYISYKIKNNVYENEEYRWQIEE